MIYLFSLLLILTTSLAHAAPPARASYFNLAWMRVPHYIYFCLNDSQCQLEPEQKDLLVKILKSYKQEKELVFTNDRKNPKLFAKVGAHRIAVTGDRIGSPIYINEDELANIDYGTAIAILVHELGHHHGVADTEDRVLDILGAKVKQYILNKAEWTDLAEYNQPQIAMMVLNSPEPMWHEQNDSEVLFFNGDEAAKFELDTLAPIPCPLDLKRKGGIVFTQPRQAGLTDWRPPAKQGFIFELNVKLVCESSQETYISWATASISNAFEFPNGMPRSADWWKNQKAIASRKSQGLISSLAISDDLIDNRPNIPLEVIELKTPQKQLNDGDTLSFSARVRAPLNKPIEGCRAHLSSRDFVRTLDKPRYRIELTSCRLRSLGNSTYDLEASYKFPSPTPSRDYYIESLQIHTAQEQIRFVADIGPRQMISLKSKHLPRPLKIISGSVTEKSDGGSINVVARDLKWASGEVLTTARMKSIFGVTFFFESESPVLPASHLYGIYSWIRNKEENRMDGLDRRVVNSVEDWYFPWGGSTVLQNSPNSPNQWGFQLALRPYTLTNRPRTDVHELHQIDFTYLWLINENLQELYADLDFQIKTR